MDDAIYRKVRYFYILILSIRTMYRKFVRIESSVFLYIDIFCTYDMSNVRYLYIHFRYVRYIESPMFLYV